MLGFDASPAWPRWVDRQDMESLIALGKLERSSDSAR
jgi:hypothetical protein